MEMSLGSDGLGAQMCGPGRREAEEPQLCSCSGRSVVQAPDPSLACQGEMEPCVQEPADPPG